MMIVPAQINYIAYQGATFNTTITITSGTSGLPFSVEGYGAKFEVGPYMTLTNRAPTISGSITMGGANGTIGITISGSATQTFYSSQPYFLQLTDPVGNTGYLLNGRINFINPFNQTIERAVSRTIEAGGEQSVGLKIQAWPGLGQ